MILRVSVIAILHSLCAFHCFSQDILSGQIVDDRSVHPLPYANIRIQSKMRGTVSNQDGRFVLNLQQEDDKKDTLVISYMGYTTVHVAIQDALAAQPNFIIRLKESRVTLKEIVVKPTEYLKNPSKIVSEAIRRIPLNCYSGEFVSRGFFRQVHREDDTYKRLIEAAVTIYDKGYSSSTSESRINIPELRKSYDLREMRNERLWSFKEDLAKNKKKNLLIEIEEIFADSSKQKAEDIRRREQKYVSLRGFLLKDLIRSYQLANNGNNIGFLNNDFVRNHKFKLDTISSLNDNEVYVVKILPSSRSERYSVFSKSLIVPVGKIYVRTSDFAIVQLDYNYILNPKKKGSQDYDVWLAGRGSGIAFSISIVYSEYSGKLYLSSLRTSEPDPISRGGQRQKQKESGYTRGYFFLERYFIVTEIITDKSEVVGVSRSGQWNEDLYTKKYQYNPQFWKNNSILKETAQEEKLIQDLQKKAELDEQFEKTN